MLSMRGIMPELTSLSTSLKNFPPRTEMAKRRFSTYWAGQCTNRHKYQPDYRGYAFFEAQHAVISKDILGVLLVDNVLELRERLACLHLGGSSRAYPALSPDPDDRPVITQRFLVRFYRVVVKVIGLRYMCKP